MEKNQETKQPDTAPEQEAESYVPRPRWQVWGARISLVLFLLFVIWQILNIAAGGL